MYKFPIEQCDVIDKVALETYRTKREEWLFWLRKDEVHSIWRQISSLIRDDILFRTISDLRRDAVSTSGSRVGFNGNILRLIDAGFLTTQATAIRRLTEHQPRDPKKGIISLRRIVSEIREHHEIFTREIHVAYDGLPYDSAASCGEWLRKQQNDGTLENCQRLPTTGPEAWGSARLAHKNFDRLSKCTNVEKRKRGDQIDLALLDRLNQTLDTCNDIRKYVDKFIAHAADPKSREGLSDEQAGISVNRLRECHKALYNVAAVLHGPLLYQGSYGAVPTPQYDHLENIEKPWVTERGKARAYELWKQHAKEVEGWESGDLRVDES